MPAMKVQKAMKVEKEMKAMKAMKAKEVHRIPSLVCARHVRKMRT